MKFDKWTNCLLLAALFSHASAEGDADLGCPIRSYRFKDYCYEVEFLKAVHDMANMTCHRMGGILAPILDEETHDFIQKLRIKKRLINYWINLNDRANEGIWRDGDNAITKFHRWAPSGLNNLNGNQNCADMNLYRYFMWDDDFCWRLNYYICQYPVSKCQHRSNVHTFGQYCYELSTEFATFDQSLDKCQKKGGMLANVKNEALHQFLVELIHKERRWMNLSKKEVDEILKNRNFPVDWFGLRNDNIKWFFNDGTPLTSFAKWTHFKAGKGCAFINKTWEIADCETHKGFICRYEISKNKAPQQVPPKWEITPRNVAVSVGQSVIVDCRATGYPQPTISWMRSLESKAQDRCFVDNTDIVNVFPNGSLYFRHIAKTDEGYYYCTANNDIGNLSKAIIIKVNTAPEFRMRQEEILAKKGEHIRIPCGADGGMPMQYTWTVNKKSLEEWFGNGRMKLNIRNNETTKETVSELIIFSAEQKDSVTFYCTAVNSLGKDVKCIRLVVQDVPDSPEFEKPILVVNQSVQLSWSLPFEGNSPIRQYFIQYKKENDNWNEHHSSSLVVDFKRTSKLISNLQPATSYVFRISAENAIGNSNYSQEIFVKTEKIESDECSRSGMTSTFMAYLLIVCTVVGVSVCGLMIFATVLAKYHHLRLIKPNENIPKPINTINVISKNVKQEEVAVRGKTFNACDVMVTT